MTKEFIKKNIRLSLELDSYMAKNPKLLNKVPNGASLIIVSSSDRKLSKENLNIAKKSRSNNFIVAHKEGNNWSLESLESHTG